MLSQGFAYENDTPIPIGLWNQPGYDVNANDQKGGFWRVQFSGLDSVSAVPEQAAAWLLLVGITGLALTRSRHHG